MKKSVLDITRYILYASVIIGVLLIAIGLYAFFSYNSNGASTSTISVTNSSYIYAPSTELTNVTKIDPNATLATFSCNSNSDCVLVHTQACFNNEPEQQSCINQANASSYQQYYQNYTDTHKPPCAAFLLEASVGCSCINNGCSLIYNSNSTG